MAQAVVNAPSSEQIAADEVPSDEIIVTARKRDETSIAVPVVLTAVSGAQLERRAIVRIDHITKLVPQLQLAGTGGNVQGGHVGIRGIAGAESNPFADQAVAFNVDGVQVSRAQIRRLAEMDIGQIEVLKGPQALFFGKNSPAGVISIRSADPTRNFQAKASAGYEIYAHEWRGEGFISGPITDTIGARLAVFGTKMRGWFDNDIGDSNAFNALAPKHSPKSEEFATRGTVTWRPSDRFNARLKASFNHLSDDGVLATTELLRCPLGVPQLGGGPDNCKLDGQSGRPYLGPYLGTLSERYPEDGKPFLKTKQALVSYEMNYDVTDALTLTSVTGYYYLRQALADTFNLAYTPAQNLSSANEFGNNEFSQELRLRSSYDGPVNFTVGGYYQSTKAFSGNTTFIGLERVNGVNPSQLNNYMLKQRGTAYSLFGQLSFKPVETFELSAGGRYSFERKRLPFIASQTGGTRPGPAPRVVVPPDPRYPRRDSWKNFSPEITASYRPTRDLNLFASYRRGFLSGGFNAGVSNFNSDLRYDQQIIKGFEGGLKAALFDRSLRVNLAAYRYIITGLQITTSQTSTSGSLNTVINAGKVTIKGLEGDFNYRTPLAGLSFHGAAGYNDAKYNVFSVNCFTGQTQEQGCNLGAFTTRMVNGKSYTTYALQDLAGQPLFRAPKWTGNLGTTYERDIGSSLRFAIDGDMSFSSSYYGNITNNPRNKQKAFQLLDASARIGAQDESWELALIGHNLTDKYYGVRIFDRSLAGSGTGRAANDPGGRVLADQIVAVNRGREILLRLTVRYGG